MLLFIIGKIALSLMVLAVMILVIIKIKRHVSLKYDHSINLLKTRYARGEIKEKEFKERLAVLVSE